MADIAAVHRIIDRDFERTLDEFRRYLGQPGISQSGEGMRESAELTLDYVRRLKNTEVRLVEAGGFPVILGKTRSNQPDAKTLLLYCFYDEVPVVPADWAVPPFPPSVVDPGTIGLPETYGEVLCGRGTIDHRGPLLAALQGLHAMQEAMGDLPVNIVYAIEGEEEIGSPNLSQFVHTYQDELREADAFWFPRMSIERAGGPMVVHRGYKGQIWLNLIARGGARGGTLDGRDIWAANVAWVDSPLWRLTRAVNTLVDVDDRISIDGFWDHVRPFGESEKRDVAKLLEDFDEEAVKRSLKIARFKNGKSGKDLFAHYAMNPHMNLGLGVLPGRPTNPEYTKGVVDGTYKTELVMNAYARLDIRLVPDLEKELVMSLLRQHLDKRGFQDISVEDARPGYSWSRTEATADIFTALTRACAARGIEPLVWPTMPSTAPFNLFNRSPLQLPIIAFGAGQGAWWHEANEYISVEGIREFMKTMTLWLHEWAEGAPQ